MKAYKIDEAFGFALLVQMCLHKRCDLPTLVGLLRGGCTSAQDCVNLIERCAVADLVDWVPEIEKFVVKFEVTQDVQLELDQFQYPLPMVIEPREIKNNRQTGYLINSGSVILKNNHHEDDVCLDHLNRMNAIPLTINKDTVRMVQNTWRNLDKMKEGETRADFERRKKAFEKYDRVSHDVIAVLIKQQNRFHITHRYCKRGRTYAQGYHINPQGTAWNKSVVEFAEQEIIE